MEELDIEKINKLKMTYPRESIYYKALTNLLNELERLQRENHYTFLMSISCDGNCQICEHFKNEFLLETENRHLKKGINTLMNKRKKWKNRYYKLETKNLNITRELLSRTDKLNELLNENTELKEQYKKIYSEVSKLIELKDKVIEIRDKAECTDYYGLCDVIDDLNKLLGDE